MARRLTIEWTEEAEEHIAAHNVTPEEVGESCTPSYAMYRRGRVRTRQRYVILGQTMAGRYLFVVLDTLGRDRFRLVTARDMTDSERRLYQRQTD